MSPLTSKHELPSTPPAGQLLQVINCKERLNANPGSLVGHVAVRAHLHHLCMSVNKGRAKGSWS